MTTIVGNFGTSGALHVETDIDHIQDSLEALGEHLLALACLRGLTTFQLIVLVDPTDNTGVTQ